MVTNLWVVKDDGNICEGLILGRVGDRPGSHFYQMELVRPCKVRNGLGKDADVFVAPAGVIVNITFDVG